MPALPRYAFPFAAAAVVCVLAVPAASHTRVSLACPPRTARLLSTRRGAVAVQGADAEAVEGADSEATGGDAEETQDDLHLVCSRCGAVYVADMALFRGKGARVRCGVCGNAWFQPSARLVPKPPHFALKDFPEDQMTDRPAAIDAPRDGGEINLFVGNMPFSLTDVGLARLFGEYGRVTKAMLMRDEIGRSRGFGFVEMATEAEGLKAVEALNDMDMQGRSLTVAPREMRSGDGGSGRGRPRS